MQIVIEIPEGAKQAFDCAESSDLKGSFYDFGGVIGNAIKNGITLSDHHRRLLDKIKEDIADFTIDDSEDDYQYGYNDGLLAALEVARHDITSRKFQ